jgi:hypothetical protein
MPTPNSGVVQRIQLDPRQTEARRQNGPERRLPGARRTLYYNATNHDDAKLSRGSPVPNDSLSLASTRTTCLPCLLYRSTARVDYPSPIPFVAIISTRGSPVVLSMPTKILPRVLLLLANAGCSFIFVKSPPDTGGHATLTRRDCTTSKTAPVFDSIFAGLEGARIIYAATTSDDTYQNNKYLTRGSDIALGAGFAALLVGSAVYGYVQTSRCSRQQSEFSPDVHMPASRPSAKTPPAEHVDSRDPESPWYGEKKTASQRAPSERRSKSHRDSRGRDSVCPAGRSGPAYRSRANLNQSAKPVCPPEASRSIRQHFIAQSDHDLLENGRGGRRFGVA